VAKRDADETPLVSRTVVHATSSGRNCKQTA